MQKISNSGNVIMMMIMKEYDAFFFAFMRKIGFIRNKDNKLGVVKAKNMTYQTIMHLTAIQMFLVWSVENVLSQNAAAR